MQFLQHLPMFFEHPGEDLNHFPQQSQEAVHILQSEAINCASALECRFAFHDSMLYQLAVLFEATAALATGMPAVFYVHALVISLFHRTLSVNLGKYPDSRNRYCRPSSPLLPFSKVS